MRNRISHISRSSKRFSLVFFALGLIAIFFLQIAFAAPPDSPYIPGETLDPGCAPGSANCRVIMPLTASTTLSAGSILFGANASSSVNQNNSQLFWDNTNLRLGIGTTQPSATLHVMGNVSTLGNLDVSRSVSLYNTLWVRNDLIGYWNLNEGNGTTTVDQSGNGHPGILSGFALSGTSSNWATGSDAKEGYALNFSGPDDVVANLSGVGLTQLTVSVWIKPGTAAAMGMFQWAVDSGSAQPFIEFRRDAGEVMRLYVDGGYQVTDVSSPTGQYTHIAVALDTSNLWTIYINGVSAGTYQDDAVHVHQANAASIWLGNGFGGSFVGSIDDVRVYNRALSSGTISSLYNASTSAYFSFTTGNPGNVGIGTSSPANMLHLYSTSTLGLTFENTGLVGGKRFDFRLGSIASGTLDIFDFTSSTSRLSISASGHITVSSSLSIATTTLPSNALFTIGTSTTIFNVLSNGRVGIGTATPSSKLDIYGGATEQLQLHTTNPEVAGTIGPSLDLRGIWSSGDRLFARVAASYEISGASLIFSTMDSSAILRERMRIRESGNVMIGTSTDSGDTFHIVTASGVSGAGIKIEQAGGAGGSSVPQYGLYSTVTGNISSVKNIAGYFSSTNSPVANYAIIVPSGGGVVGIGTSDPSATLHVVGSSTVTGFAAFSATTTFSGNVGIGTSQPSSKLHVVGSAIFTGTASSTGLTFVNATGTTLTATTGVFTTASSTGLTFTNATGSGSIALFSLTQGSILFAGAGGVLSQDNTNIFFDDTNNRLGLGTTQPSSTLHVAGTSQFTATSTFGGFVGIGVGTSSPITQLHVAGATPTLVGRVSTDPDAAAVTYGEALYVQNRYLYNVNYASGTLQIFDVSNPTSPSLVGSVGGMAGANAVYVQGRYAYIALDCSGTAVVDISNPSAPIIVGTTGQHTCTESVYVQGKYAYFGAVLGSNNLFVIDVSNPAAPVEAGRFNGTGATPTYVQGRYAYTNRGIFDVSNPVSINLVFSSSSNLGGMVAHGRLGYSGTAGVFRVWDISSSTNPVVLGSTTGIGGGTMSPYIQGRYAYLTSPASSTLYVVDISSSTAPRVVVSVATDPTPSWRPIVQGRYLYLKSRASSTLQIFDIGGAYIQQLEAGGIEVSTLSARNNLQVFNDAEIGGGLTIGRGANITGGFAVSGASSSRSFFTVDYNGLVGIGTSTPSSILHLYSTSTLGLTFENTGLNGGRRLDLRLGSVASGTLDIFDFTSSTSRFSISPSGNVGIGTAQPSSTLHLVGTSIFTGTSTFNGGVAIATSSQFSTTSTLTVCARSNCTVPSTASSSNTVAFFASTGGATTDISIVARGVITSGLADIGEFIHVVGNPSTYHAGDVLSVAASSSGQFEKSRTAYDTKLAGVVTETAGFVAGGGEDNHGRVVIALAGRVPVKVSLANGPILAGDYLTASSETGIAMRATEPGNTLGIALESFGEAGSSTSTTGAILHFVRLQWSPGSLVMNPESGNTNQISTASSTTSTGPLDQFTGLIQVTLKKLGLLLENGIAKVKELFADKVTTKQLCVDDTCINRDQLKALLDGTTPPSAPSSGGGGGAPPPEPEPSPAPTSTPSSTEPVVEPAPDSTQPSPEATAGTAGSPQATSTPTSTLPSDVGTPTSSVGVADPEPSPAPEPTPEPAPEPIPDSTGSPQAEPAPEPPPSTPEE